MSNVESASNPKPVNSGFGDPWTPDEKQRLYELRQQYKNLTWQEFQMVSCSLSNRALRFYIDWSCHKEILSKAK